MKIDRDSVRAPNRIYGRSGTTHRTSPLEPVAAAPADRVNLSEESRVVGDVREQLAAQPEVRAQLIQSLKAQIEQGAYSVHARNLADRLLNAKVFTE